MEMYNCNVFSCPHHLTLYNQVTSSKLDLLAKMQSNSSSLKWQLLKLLSVWCQSPKNSLPLLAMFNISTLLPLYRQCIMNVVVQVQQLPLLHLFHFLTLKTLRLIIIEGKSKGVG